MVIPTVLLVQLLVLLVLVTQTTQKSLLRANFEWAYGLNGAIKGAVPRFLGFEDSYDSQFYYYLYDTSYPWNGPLFGIQYALNDIPCCPNTTCNDEYSGDLDHVVSLTSTILPLLSN